MKTLLSLLLSVLFFNGYSQIKISGEIRPRSEIRNGYKTLRDDETESAFFTSQRSRLKFEYTTKKYSAIMSIQDVRVWGDEEMGSNNPSLALNEAWVKFRVIDNLKIKLGRQTIFYDNGRLFGPANWSQSSKKHNALLFNYHSGNWNIDLGNAFNQLTENTFGTDYTNTLGNYKYLSYVWSNYTTQKVSLSCVFVADGFQHAPDTVNSRLTWGTVGKYVKNNCDITTRAFIQNGKTMEGNQITAYLINTEIGYKIENITSIAGFEIQSGNDYTKTDGKYRVFNSLYGTKHYLNGTMDYFTKASDTQNTGLLDVFLKIKQKVGKKSTFYTDYHYFATHMSYFDSSTQTEFKKYLGSEVDLYMRTSIAKDIKLEYGYSCMVGSTTLAAIKGGDNEKLNHWMYVMVSFNPIFLEKH